MRISASDNECLLFIILTTLIRLFNSPGNDLRSRERSDVVCVRSCTADIDHVSVFSCSYSDFPVRQTVIMICDEVSFSALLYFICRCIARPSWNLSFSHTHTRDAGSVYSRYRVQ